MTFSDFILRVRRRSQDLRTINGVIIDNPLHNGIRWGASDIADACNNALDEASRLLSVYDTSPIARQLTENNLIVYEDLTFSSNKSSLDDTVLAVLGLEKTGTDSYYQYIKPTEYQSYKNTISQNVANAFWFTVARNVSTFKKECWITSSDTSLRATLLLDTPEFDLTTADLAKEMPFQGIDDFLECLAEKKLRTWEGYFERVEQLLTEVQLYLGVYKGDGKT